MYIKKIKILILFSFLTLNISACSPLLALEELVKNNKTDVSQISLFITYHIKNNGIAFIKYLKDAGFKDITVIGRPYSTSPQAKAEMEKYCKILTPSSEELESLNIINQVLTPVIENPNKKFVCLDLGGYFSKYFESKKISPKNCLGIVEGTMNGIWFNIYEYTPRVPLLSIASSNIKENVEHYLIAKAIIRNSEYLLINEFQQSFIGKNILVCGYGRIGEKIASLLKRDATIYILDKDPLKLVKAAIDGLKIFQKQDQQNIDIIIGVTGNIVFSEELINLKNNVVLINGSTRQKEFAFSTIKDQIITQENFDGHTTYRLNNNKEIHVLADGFPVNFWRTESTPEFCLDALFSIEFELLIELLRRFNENQSLTPGYYPSEHFFINKERKVATIWLKKYLNIDLAI